MKFLVIIGRTKNNKLNRLSKMTVYFIGGNNYAKWNR